MCEMVCVCFTRTPSEHQNNSNQTNHKKANEAVSLTTLARLPNQCTKSYVLVGTASWTVLSQ